MRRRGLSTTGLNGHSVEREDFLLPFWPAACAMWGHVDARGSHRSGKNG